MVIKRFNDTRKGGGFYGKYIYVIFTLLPNINKHMLHEKDFNAYNL